MKAMKEEHSKKNQLFINTTGSDDIFINTTESDNIFNISLSQPISASNQTYTRGDISRTASADSIQGGMPYFDTNSTILLPSTEESASESFDDSGKPETKRMTSTTERQKPEPPDVHYAIKHGVTFFNRQHKHISRLFQHHLQLMPMDDEPFDVFKDHRYVMSVLVPICVVTIGAALIMATVFSLKYVARRRAVGDFPLNDGSSLEKQAQSISRISSERTDRMLLLSVEDDADM